MSLVLARMTDTPKRDMVIAALALVDALEDFAYTRKEEDKKRIAECQTYLCAMARKLRKEFGLEDAPAGS